MPWVTNLRPSGFVVAAAVARDNAPPAIVALDHGTPRPRRSPDLDLLGLRSSHTAAIRLDTVDIDDGDLLAADGPVFLRRVRPAFLGLQCGLSIRLARTSLAAARQASADTRHALRPRLAEVQQRLDDTTGRLLAGVRDGRFVEQAVPLFRLRLTLVRGRAGRGAAGTADGRRASAYLLDRTAGFARCCARRRLVPIVTPERVAARSRAAEARGGGRRMNAALALQGRGLGLRYRAGRARVRRACPSTSSTARSSRCSARAAAASRASLRLLAGLSPPSEGEVEFLGQRSAAPHPRAALVFQQAALLPWLSVERNGASASISGTSRSSAAPSGRRAWPRRSTPWGWRARAACTRRSCRAAWRSAWRWPVRSRASRGCCWPTSRSRRSTPSPAPACRTCCVDVVRRWDTAALLVTHDIDEAILVADRIVLMGGRPARVQRTGSSASTARAPPTPTVSPRCGWRSSRRCAIPPPCPESSCHGFPFPIPLRHPRHATAASRAATCCACPAPPPRVALRAAVRRRCPCPGLQGRRRAGAHRLPADHRRHAAAGGPRPQRPVRSRGPAHRGAAHVLLSGRSWSRPSSPARSTWCTCCRPPRCWVRYGSEGPGQGRGLEPHVDGSALTVGQRHPQRQGSGRQDRRDPVLVLDPQHRAAAAAARQRPDAVGQPRNATLPAQRGQPRHAGAARHGAGAGRQVDRGLHRGRALQRRGREPWRSARCCVSSATCGRTTRAA